MSLGTWQKMLQETPYSHLPLWRKGELLVPVVVKYSTDIVLPRSGSRHGRMSGIDVKPLIHPLPEPSGWKLGNDRSHLSD
jgi:hypothetical protein